MVMPFVAQDLGHIMKKRRLTDRIITYLFYQLLRGLKVNVNLFAYLTVRTYPASANGLIIHSYKRWDTKQMHNNNNNVKLERAGISEDQRRALALSISSLVYIKMQKLKDLVVDQAPRGTESVTYAAGNIHRKQDKL